MKKYFSSNQVRTWLCIVVAVALVERVLLYLVYHPVIYNDTASYRRLAEAILAGWGGYDGTRTPGYPLFLALVGADRHVYAVQLFLGFLTTLLLFYIAWRIGGRGWLAGVVALAHTLNPQQIFFEADLLTESLTTFLIILSMAFLVVLIFSKKPGLWRVIGLALGTGLTAGCAALTRPLFIFLPFWIAFILLVFWRAKPGFRWGGALMASLSGALVLGLWVNFIYQRFNMLSLTTMNGFHLVQNTGLYFEYVPDKYAAIRDVYLQYRAEQIIASGSPGNAIWDAIPAMEKASGLGFYDLSRLLTKISLQLIIDHPWDFLKNVMIGWFGFWKVPVYFTADSFIFPWLGAVSKGLILGWRGILILFNIAFVIGSVLLVWRRFRRVLHLDSFQWQLLGTLWLTSIAQTLLDHGDNPRFEVPVQSLLVLMVVCWGTRLILTMGKNNENPAA